uniref:Probable aflatoxin efflux pump AFLT n=1 Tax=Melanopsichium pennsylvanicum 4 TaxID=1398559 RepID=A0A077QZE5_9BASI|nr:probable aflatoxin efflux pump AFLT [Melanopsichium pennsylvanicum 4]
MWFFEASMTVIFYYVPVLFQVLQGAALLQSKFRALATFVSSVVASILSGVTTKETEYYTPRLLLPPILGAVRVGMVTTWSSTTPQAERFGHQLMHGLGMGAGMTVASVTVQASLPQANVLLAIGLEMIPQLKGRTAQLSKADASEILKEVEGSGEQVLKQVIDAIDAALRRVWYLALALTLAVIVPFFLIGWLILNTVVKRRTEERAAAQAQGARTINEA